MKYFTSDWHLDEDRIGSFNPFFRPFKTIKEQNDTIINNCLQTIKPEDTLYFIGDVSKTKEGLELLNKINCYKILIKGNYDIPFEKDLHHYFDEVYDELIINIDKIKFYLNHYPINVKEKNKNTNIHGICGHIHSLWKVMPFAINVSCDAWHFNLVSEKDIEFIYNATKHYYDENVFPYEI